MNNANVEMVKMRSLMERMEKPMTGFQALISEEKMVNEGVTREVKSASDAFDILDSIGDNKFVSIGYVTGVNLNATVKRKNPATNRMKSYPDYEGITKAVSSDEPVSALVKITSYNLRYMTTSKMADKYSQYKDSANQIRQKYGLPEIGHKNYKTTVDFGNGVSTYGGNNEKLNGHTYSAQNVHNCRKHAIIYAVNQEGHIISEIDKQQIIPFLKSRTYEVDGVSALRKLEKDDATIDAYTKDIQALKMDYKNFEYNSILYVVATVNGQKIIYINDNLMRNVEGIDIQPADFIAIAKARYAESLQEIEAEESSMG